MHLFLLFLSRSLDIIRYRKCQPYNICLYYQVTWQGSNSRLTGINQLCVRYTNHCAEGLLFLPSLLRPGWLSNIIGETDKYKYAFKKIFKQLKLKGWVLILYSFSGNNTSNQICCQTRNCIFFQFFKLNLIRLSLKKKDK